MLGDSSERDWTVRSRKESLSFARRQKTLCPRRLSSRNDYLMDARFQWQVKKAKDFYGEPATESGVAKLKLAKRLLDGRGVRQDAEEGEFLLRDAAAAGDAAKLELAQRLLDGRVCPRTADEGSRLFEEVSTKRTGMPDAREFCL